MVNDGSSVSSLKTGQPSARADSGSIGIIGGTGPAGVALAQRLAVAGRTVMIGSREMDRAVAAIAEIRARTKQPNLQITAGSNAEAASCAGVVLAVTAVRTVSVAEEYRSALDGRIVVSMASRLRRDPRGFRTDSESGSTVAEDVQRVLPGSRVVAALHHLPAEQFADPGLDIDADILVCGDDADAVATVTTAFGPLTSGRVLDAGPLANSAALEALTAVLVTLNVRERRAYSIRLVDQAGAAEGAGSPGRPDPLS